MKSSVAIQGIRGSYSEDAALKLVGEAELVECIDFAETFAALESDRAEYVVVPVENKIVGEIAGTMSILRRGGFRVHERLPLRVEHVLAVAAGSELNTITAVRSHVEALKQCGKFLDSNPHWRRVIGADTAASVKRIVENGDPAIAAIGSRRAAEMYGAKILAENIADDHDNWTTFCLVGKQV